MSGFKSGSSPNSSFVSLRAKRSNPRKGKTNKRLLRHFRLLHYIRNDIPRNDKARKQCVTKVLDENKHLHGLVKAWFTAWGLMTGELKYITFNTDMGWLGILGSAKGLLGTTLPQRSVQEVRQLLGDSVNHATRAPVSFEDLMERLRTYFSGHKATFPDELDLSRATSFERQVWEVTRLIPYGETRSYSWVAEQIGRPGATRAVGQALARNPLPIVVPCHRILTINARLGGYSGGVEMKRYLLYLEAAASIG